MTLVTRREREREEMRRAILDAAMRLFLDQGFERVSMREIARAIEYSPAAIYSYFKDKDAILGALHEEGFGKLLVLQQSTRAIADPLERMRQHGLMYMQFAMEHREYYDLMFIERAPVKDLAAGQEWEAGMRSYNELLDAVHACIAAGYFPGAAPESVALAMWSMVHGMASLIIRNRLGNVPAGHLNAMIADVIDMLLPSHLRGA